MWLSSSEEQHHHHKALNKNLSTHSSKSSSSSTPSNYNHPNNPIFNKTMEEVWKDINLSCSRDHIDPQNASTSNTNFGGMILQDFLARPFANDHHPTATPVPAPPHAVTMLALNSTGRDQLYFLSNLNPLRQSSISQQNTISHRPLGSPAGRKRYPDQSDNNNSGDQKNKRMIKNRESAARSRARKQESAYTNELETEIAHLMEENARLKRQQQQLCLASTAQLPKKNSLYRTSTAPF
ncbi:hypothetical protein K7X08_033841 [Anisodus acutangulus]|uniref:BZIP domain-containing protein n=1 Tax=Anisodus acutangulus TaxID=402998 RepID=A0A9Q1M2H1_9SOLA|nr:hypothetical protein K7X08_033841 [Anisodus acutangulus]